MLAFYLSMLETQEEKDKFQLIYTKYNGHFLTVANRILKDEVRAEAAVIKAYEIIINNIEKIFFPMCHKTEHYLVTIVKNVAIDMYRKQKPVRNVPLEEVEDYLFVRESVETSENMDVRAMLCKLHPSYREIMLLKFDQRLPNSEIASTLGITEENVRQRLARAKEKARKILIEMGDSANVH